MFICIYLPFPPRKSSFVGGAFFCAVAAGRRPPPSLLPSLPSLILSAMPQPHYAALICFTSDIQGKTLAACVDYTLQDHDRPVKNIGAGMVGNLNWNKADNNIEVHGDPGMDTAGRGRVFARRRINLVDEMAVNERRERAGKSERARAGEMVRTKGPDGRGRLIRPCED